MPVSTVDTSFTYKPGSAMLPEAVPFQFFDASDLVVTHISVAGVRFELSPAAYVVAGNGLEKTGSIRATGAWPNDDLFLIERKTERVQKANIKPHEPVPAVDVTQQLDRTMLVVQEQDGAIDDLDGRAITVPIGERAPNLIPRALRTGGNKILGPNPVTGDIAVLDGSDFQGSPGGNAESVGTFAAAQAMILDPDGGVQQVRVTDRGKATYEQFAQDIEAAGLGLDQFVTPDGKRWRLPLLTAVSAKALGAAEGGDDRLAIARAMVLSRDTVQDPAKGDGRVVQQRGVVLETGTYAAGGIIHDIYTAQNATGTSEVLLEAAPGARVTIVIPAGQYFMEVLGRIQGGRIKGIRFVGGKGAFRFANPGNNVNLPMIFEDCVFLDYTECAIGTLSEDAPYWHITGCRFTGTPTSKGLVLGGYLDGCVIERNVFDRNRYNIQIGPRLSGSFLIELNDFIKNGDDFYREADILICPNTDSYSFGNSAGLAGAIRANKFGNENLSRYEDRIIIANLDPTSGIDRMSQRHSQADRGGYVNGLIITDNRMATKFVAGSDLGDGNDGNFIHSFIKATRNFTLERNKQEGGRYRWYVYHEVGPDLFDYHVSQNWSVTLDPSNTFQYGVSNRSVGRISDPYSAMPSDKYVTQPVPLRDDEDVVFYKGTTRAGIVDHTPVATVDGPMDRYGGPWALVTVPSAGDYIAFPLLPLDYTDAPFWWTFDIAPVADESRRLREVNIAIYNRDTQQIAAIRQVQIMRSHKVVLHWDMPPTTSQAWEARIIPSFPPIGAANQFLLSRSYINSGRLPVNPSHLSTLGGRWNTPHMVMDPYHLWVDAANRLRIKGDGPPTSDTDGEIVGAQS